MELQLLKWSWLALGFGIIVYLTWGVRLDRREKSSKERTAAVLPTLSILLFDANDEAAIAFEELANTNRRVLLDVAQSLALDINGEARERLQQLARSTGLERSIRRRSKHRRWRHRVQAAQLHYLVVHPDFDRSLLLRDKHPLVRARAAEALTADQAVEHVEDLAYLMTDDSLAVRIGAQNSLLRAGSAAVEPLLRMLQAEGPQVAEAMHVAANLPDQRLVGALANYSTSADPQLRAMTATALGSGTGLGAIELLRNLLNDEDADVRSAAVSGLQRLESRESVAAIGVLLADSAWRVRRAAGYALDGLGAPGQLILRRALSADDPYARDMARQVLDGSMALSARARTEARLVGVS